MEGSCKRMEEYYLNSYFEIENALSCFFNNCCAQLVKNDENHN